jgi:asparaginyl-tRNA synthetase
MIKYKIKDILSSEKINFEAVICGWVRTSRDAKDFCFIEINDGSAVDNIQIIAENTLGNYQEILNLTTGSSVSVTGDVVQSLGKGQKFEIRAKNIRIFGYADAATYPLQKKRHSFEFLREISHLRPRTNSMGAVFRLRNALSFAIHSFFQELGFIYVQTPVITSSDCEGAGEMFKVTTFDLAKVPLLNGKVDFSQDFFGRKTGLTVSGQLEGELLALALGDIYTFGPTFRAENSNTSRHLSEFWMVEPEMAFAELTDDIKLAEDFIRHIFKYCLEKASVEMKFFNDRIEPGIIDKIEGIVKSSFEIITYTEAVSILEKSGEKFEFPVKWGSDLQSEHERYITEKKFGKPVFIINYPKEIKAFYMKLDDDGKTVKAMDLLVPGIGEIIGGSEREDRYDILLERMIGAGLNPEEYSWYLDTRRYGSAPHAGFGLGFERAVQFISGMQNIRDVIPFPRTPKSAGF